MHLYGKYWQVRNGTEAESADSQRSFRKLIQSLAKWSAFCRIDGRTQANFTKNFVKKRSKSTHTHCKRSLTAPSKRSETSKTAWCWQVQLLKSTFLLSFVVLTPLHMRCRVCSKRGGSIWIKTICFESHSVTFECSNAIWIQRSERKYRSCIYILSFQRASNPYERLRNNSLNRE